MMILLSFFTNANARNIKIDMSDGIKKSIGLSIIDPIGVISTISFTDKKKIYPTSVAPAPKPDEDDYLATFNIRVPRLKGLSMYKIGSTNIVNVAHIIHNGGLTGTSECKRIANTSRLIQCKIKLLTKNVLGAKANSIYLTY